MTLMPSTRNYDLPPFDIIQAAISGDISAIRRIVKHYESYIATLATKTVYDRWGNSYRHLDEELKQELEIELIMAIPKFQIR